MDAASFCIDCNWAYAGLLDAIALVVAAVSALLAALSALATWFEGTGPGGAPYPNAAGYNTADDIGTGVAQGGLGIANAAPTPPGPPTSVPPPAGQGAPGIGEQFFDIVGYDLLNLGRQ